MACMATLVHVYFSDYTMSDPQLDDGCADVPPLVEQDVDEEEGGEEPPLPSFFAEREEAVGIIQDVGKSVGLDPSGRAKWMGEDGGVGVASRLFQLEAILVRYQEVPTLLLPHPKPPIQGHDAKRAVGELRGVRWTGKRRPRTFAPAY